MLAKLALVPVLLVIACLFAGLYGALHNQISYTVSPEYFTQFKFHQFRVSERVPDRVGAAMVGWFAAWWMGIVIGVVLIPFGLLLHRQAFAFWDMLRVFGVVAVTTLIAGLLALAVAFAVVDAESIGSLSPYGDEVVDDVAFVRAGTMHNFSYLGGMLGIGTGAVMIVRQRGGRRASLDGATR